MKGLKNHLLNNQSMIKTIDLEMDTNFPCNNCNFISKTEAYLQIDQSTKHEAHKTNNEKTVIYEENGDDSANTDDDED